MPRFLTGDDLGNIKSFNYLSSSNVSVSTLYDATDNPKQRAVQKLAIQTSADGPLVR
jgi:ribosome biogenesis protein NSA1